MVVGSRLSVDGGKSVAGCSLLVVSGPFLAFSASWREVTFSRGSRLSRLKDWIPDQVGNDIRGFGFIGGCIIAASCA